MSEIKNRSRINVAPAAEKIKTRRDTVKTKIRES